MLTSTECFHFAHQECLRKHVLDAIKKSENVECRLCYRPIEHNEYIEYLTFEERNQIDELLLKSFMESDPNIKSCPKCKN
jgi:hypothetical protein